MKKRVVSLFLTCAMAASLLAACGGNTGSSDKDASSNAGESTEQGDSEQGDSEQGNQEAAQGEPEHVVMSLLVAPGGNLAGVPGVQDAINAISIPEINVEIELKTVELFEAGSQYPLWIGGNEDLDLICSAFIGVSDFVSQGLLEPMDDLIAANAPYLSGVMQEFSMTNGAVFDDQIYGVNPVEPYYGTRYGALLRTDWVEEAGITVDADKTYTLDELEDMMAKIKEKHPDGCVLGYTGGDVNSSVELYSYCTEMDNLGTSMASGVLMGVDSTGVVNVFETEGFHDFVQRISKWKELGYIYPDAATTDMTGQDMMKNGVSAGYLMRTTPEQIAGAENQLENIEITVVNLTDYYYPTFKGNVYWSIPISCDVPDAAVKFLDLMYSNHDIAATLMYGPENVDWVRTDREDLIDYPEGVTPDTITYANGLGLFGDRRYELTRTPTVTREEYEKTTERAMANPTASKGFVYDTTNTSMQIMSVNTVLEQYLPQLECGVSADKVEQVYETFISELRAAGIDDIIADKQAQLDAYLSEQ